MKKIFILFLLGLPALFVQGQQHIEFYRENTNMFIDTNHVTVAAELFFRNTTDHSVQQMMFFPLPLRTQQIKRDSLSVYDAARGLFIKSLVKNPAGVIFSMNFLPQESKKIKLFYRDDHNGNSVTYLQMTHAKYWSGTISQGSYAIKFNEKVISIDSLTCKPDNTVIEGEMTDMNWKKVNFTPDKEVTVWFHRDK